jgi:hypothetical protein
LLPDHIVELSRGTIAERPWAITLATFARRGASGQITLLADAERSGQGAGPLGSVTRGRYTIAFERGSIVGARSPIAADSVARVALTTHAAKAEHIAGLRTELAAHPARDEIEALAAIAQLSPAQVQRLRRETILRRAARTFALEAGEYIFEDTSVLPARGVGVDVRAVVYHGIRMFMSDDRLAADVRLLGARRFVLESAAAAELHRFGFEETEWPILAALREGATLPELEARLRDTDPRAMQAAVYALVTCGTARAESSKLARGTRDRVMTPPGVPTIPFLPRAKTNPELAAEAVERAKRALDNEQIETAVLELKKACALVPTDVDYGALLGWAVFCAAHDKRAIAAETKAVLERALERSDKPHLARFYLGRVERILGHDREALQHFHAVLLSDPDHRDASAEIRVLQARLRRS